MTERYRVIESPSEFAASPKETNTAIEAIAGGNNLSKLEALGRYKAAIIAIEEKAPKRKFSTP